MASNPGKQVIQRVRSFLTSSRKLQIQSNITGLSSESSKTFSTVTGRRNPRFLSRLPVELGGMQSLMPLHSVTASALLTSMLSSKVGQWGSLSEEFFLSSGDFTFLENWCLGWTCGMESIWGKSLKPIVPSAKDSRHHYNMAFSYRKHIKLL